MTWAKALKSAVCYIDQRFEADEEWLYWQYRLKSLRFRSLISGLTLAVFWVYLELQTVDSPPLEDLDLQSILHLLGALLFAIAAFLSLTEINLEVLWLPLACMYCGLMSQLRCAPHLRVLSVAFATLVASFTVPLRAASLWLVYLTAATTFLVSDLSQEVSVASGSVAMNVVLLLLLLCSFYHAFWRAELEQRKAFVAGERVQAMCLSSSASKDEVADFARSPTCAVLSLEEDLSIQHCGEQEGLFFGSDLNGQHLMDLVSMEDQHMIGLLARTDSANRTILVNVVTPGHQNSEIGNESVKFRLLPTGLQSPKWLGFFAKGTSAAAPPGASNAGSSSMSASHTSRASAISMVRPTSPRVVLPSVPQGDPPLSPTSPRPEVAPPPSPLPMTSIRSRNSQRSNRSMESKNSLQVVDGRKQRQVSGNDLMGGSPGLRLRQLSSENPEMLPRLYSDAVLDSHEASPSLPVRQQDLGLFSNSVLSLSWSIGTECRSSLLGPATAPKSLSDAQTQTEISWTATSGWKCRNCQKPPRPPAESQTQADEVLRKTLERLQGCWRLRSGPKQCVGWLQGFVVTGIEVTTTSGTMTLENDDEGQLYFSGGLLRVDEDGVLHRTGKSGGTYLYTRVTEQHLAVNTLRSSVQQGQQGQHGQPQILRPNVRHQSWNSVISIAH